jgi:hypothetical protein
MTRKRFSERQVIEALIRTGHTILCYRTKAVITLETVKRLEREHVTPLKLGGADDPTNAAYSLSEAHKAQTKKDVAAIAKVDRLLGLTCNGAKKKIGNRGFDKTLTRKFSGETVKRSSPHPYGESE